MANILLTRAAKKATGKNKEKVTEDDTFVRFLGSMDVDIIWMGCYLMVIFGERVTFSCIKRLFFFIVVKGENPDSRGYR